jgi:hypothetical protein
MADDAPKMTKATATNVTDGPRVLNAQPIVTLQPGESTDGDVNISQPELDVAKGTGWFEFGKTAAKPAA